MKRMHFIILSCLLAQSAFSAVDGAKDDVGVLLPQVEKPVVSVLSDSNPITRADNQPAYSYPDGLSRLGTYSSENQLCAIIFRPTALPTSTTSYGHLQASLLHI